MKLEDALFPSWTPTKRLAHIYAIRCMAHRFRKFGFEEPVNALDPRSLALFAMHAHEPMASACLHRAVACEPDILRIIEAPVCPTSCTTESQPRCGTPSSAKTETEPL